jgi:hypothetical protein
MSRICLYYKRHPETDRWVRGDRFVRPAVRRLIRGKPRPSGVDRVFLNLMLGLDRLSMDYVVNLPFSKLRSDDRIGVIGRGRHVLDGYDRPNPIVAAIALMTHPSEWPTLCDEYPVTTYLSHSEWVNDLYRPYFGDRCMLWPVGIDTREWAPATATSKSVDVLIYDKTRRFTDPHEDLHQAVAAGIEKLGLSSQTLVYGEHTPAEFKASLARSRCMAFLSPHESQGLAYQEAMSAGVPIVAWDPGESEDPERHKWGTPHISTKSVPFFDDRCGTRFQSPAEFHGALALLLERAQSNRLDPRAFILENLTVERCSQKFVDYLNESRTAGGEARISPLARRAVSRPS